MFSLLSMLVACGSEPAVTPAPSATPEVPATAEVVVTPPAAPCVDSTPDNGVDECAQPATTSAATPAVPVAPVTPATPAVAK